MTWVDGNLGSKLTMKYPAVYLMEPGAHGEVLSIASAGQGQHQDAGRQDRSRRAQHDLGDHIQVALDGRADARPIAVCSRSTTAPTAAAPTSAATP